MSYIKKIVVYFLITGLFLSAGMTAKVSAAQRTSDSGLVIALDPGHGGEEDGACYYGIKEKDINLTVAEKVKKELEQYPNVTVVLTRHKEETVSLLERADRAAAANADILVSLHFNASNSHESQGASVYISTAEKYRESLQKLADNLLGEFEALGLDNAGTFARVTQMGGRRADGTFDDYYGVLRHAYNNGMPSVIIEHCYMDSERDKDFFQSEEGLDQLARADTNGIAAYYGLVKEDGETVKAKHAKVFGGTTKAVEQNYFEAPNIVGIRLLDYDGTTPGIATYEVKVEDQVGIRSIYLVYQNPKGESVTVFLNQKKGLTTGTYELKTYIPPYRMSGTYTLCYIGAYNECGYDAGYNAAGGSMVGFGKCDWLNTFSYDKEADLYIEKSGNITESYAARMERTIKNGLLNKRFHLQSVCWN